MSRSPLLILLLLSSVLVARAQTDSDGKTLNSQDRQPFFTRVRGLFDFSLPNIDPPGTIKVILHPHFGDFVRRDYMRVEGGLRWAVNDRFEINPEASVYFTHGLGGSSQDGYGVGELRLGLKYVLPEWPNPEFETSVFMNIEVPVGAPPVDLTDGFNHIAPGFLVQHHSHRFPKITTFAGAGLDMVSDSRIAGSPVRNQPLDDSMNFTAGAIYDLGQFKWTLTTTYATTAVVGDQAESFFYVRPTLLWYVPSKYTFHSKTRWLIGLGVRASWGPDGTEFSFSNRVRAEITFRQVMDKIRFRRPIGPDDSLR
ncbi:MAG: hypothetical protein RL091_293 [Verrucomicrobiota bacterium]|jgi:hypothetical protein